MVEHRIELTDDDPVHIRQFRIPLEHRQTIYDWVDELMKKGAIEVSRSTYNSPIFLVPKPHGNGMRAVLDYRAVNIKSKPDRYTIREVRDCIDEIGLAGSDTFTTIDLTDEDPVHIRQFRIPLEHRQTIYDWVDELMKKGAIEVSRSTYNSPIFLVPKPHGNGMRAVLDYCAVNLKSKPDRYTIREVRDCIDEIGLAGSCLLYTSPSPRDS